MTLDKKQPGTEDSSTAQPHANTACKCTHTRRITYHGLCYTCGKPLAVVAKKG